MEPRLGWKHEYWDRAARLSMQGSAVVSFQRAVGPLSVSPPVLRAGEQLRHIRVEDSDRLTELFLSAFDDAIDYAGYADDSYRRAAADIIASFFARPTCRPGRSSTGGHLEASFAVSSGSHIVAAVLVRSIRRGPILEPIMVHPVHWRRGLGGALLAATLDALQVGGKPTLFSRCHLGNAASLVWHEKHGFEEIPNYFVTTHRWHHFARLAEHCRHACEPDRADEVQSIADHWKSMVESMDSSDQRWSSGLLE